MEAEARAPSVAHGHAGVGEEEPAASLFVECRNHSTRDSQNCKAKGNDRSGVTIPFRERRRRAIANNDLIVLKRWRHGKSVAPPMRRGPLGLVAVAGLEADAAIAICHGSGVIVTIVVVYVEGEEVLQHRDEFIGLGEEGIVAVGRGNVRVGAVDAGLA